MVDWAALQDLIDRCDEAAVASVLRGLGPEQRQALAAPLQEHEMRLRADPECWAQQPALAVAGAAVLPGASAVAPWLARNDLIRWHPDPRRRFDATGIVLGALRDRGVPWLPDLTRLLAERLPARPGRTPLWPLVTGLVSVTGIGPPATDGFAFCWAAERGPGGIGVAEEIRRDPRLAELIPRLLKVDVVAAWFDTPRSRNGDGWPTALNMLAAEGLVDRAMLLGSCLAGLRRGGRPGAMRGLLRLHDELAPTLGEVRSHARDYLALLSGTRSTVAGMAQRQLRRLDEADMLAAGTLCDASAAVLLRTEKTLVRAQLAWLDTAVRRHPGHAGHLVLAMAAAFGQQPADLQARADGSFVTQARADGSFVTQARRLRSVPPVAARAYRPAP